jgi:hypothetical protein
LIDTMNHADRIGALLAFVQDDERVCPRPIEWNKLYDLIGGKRTDLQNPWRVVWDPAPPLILSAWGYSSDANKALRLREHIEWAARNSRLDVAENFLRQLPPEAWHHSDPAKSRY